MFSGFFFTAIAIKVVKIMLLVTCPLNCDMTISAALIFSMLPYVRMEGIIDYVEDCFDWHGHLDTEGAGKVTVYLGNWLKENYDLPDHRGEDGYAHWDENLIKYDARLRELGL